MTQPRTIYYIANTEPPTMEQLDEWQEHWLNDLQNEYDALVSRLRYLDRTLVQHGKKKRLLLVDRRER